MHLEKRNTYDILKKAGIFVWLIQIYKKKLNKIKKAPQKRGASSQIYS